MTKNNKLLLLLLLLRMIRMTMARVNMIVMT